MGTQSGRWVKPGATLEGEVQVYVEPREHALSSELTMARRPADLSVSRDAGFALARWRHAVPPRGRKFRAARVASSERRLCPRDAWLRRSPPGPRIGWIVSGGHDAPELQAPSSAPGSRADGQLPNQDDCGRR